MEIELKNLKGTRDYLPAEQQFMHKIKNTLENVFQKYVYRRLKLRYYACLISFFQVARHGDLKSLPPPGSGNETGTASILTVPFPE